MGQWRDFTSSRNRRESREFKIPRNRRNKRSRKQQDIWWKRCAGIFQRFSEDLFFLNCWQYFLLGRSSNRHSSIYLCIYEKHTHVTTSTANYKKVLMLRVSYWKMRIENFIHSLRAWKEVPLIREQENSCERLAKKRKKQRRCGLCK